MSAQSSPPPPRRSHLHPVRRHQPARGGSGSTSSRYVARSPTDLVAIVPVVLGFHPADSVVLLTFGGPGPAFHARVDLPLGIGDQEDVAAALVGAAEANRVERAAVLLYTDDAELAWSMTTVLVGQLVLLGIEVIDSIRVDDGRWHGVPDDGTRGTAYDLDAHPFTAQGVFEGTVVHRDRDEVADTLVGTDEDDSIEVALAATRFADLLEAGVAGDDRARLLRDEARWLQRVVRDSIRRRTSFAAADAGRLLVLASLVATRDVAWAEITRPRAKAHAELWRGLVRRAPRHLLPGACSLLAFAAWQAGDGALSWCALDRCLEVDPDYSMAHCIAQLLTGAVSPDIWEPLTDADLPVLAGGEDPVMRPAEDDRRGG